MKEFEIHVLMPVPYRENVEIINADYYEKDACGNLDFFVNMKYVNQMGFDEMHTKIIVSYNHTQWLRVREIRDA